MTVNAKPVSHGPPAWLSILVGFGPAILLVLVFVWLFRRTAAQGGAVGLMGFGRSRARRVEGHKQHVTFADVAGIDEAEQELTGIVEFLREPSRFTRLGGRMARGVLLIGRPERERPSWPAPWRAKPEWRSSTSPRRNSSR